MNAIEKKWDREVRELGCIVCLERLGIENPEAEAHHFVMGGKRKGEMYKIGLCQWHHRGGNDSVVSRHSINGKHGGKAAFEDQYGTEGSLLEKTRERLGWDESAWADE